MYKIAIATLAVAIDQIVETGKEIGTSSNQKILGMLVVALIGVVLYREFQQVRANRTAENRHREALEKADEVQRELTERMDKDRGAMDEERRQRISMLMTAQDKNTLAMEKTANAVDNNTRAITDLKGFMRDQGEMLKGLLSSRKRK